jgi:SAM-dependent methyltransferase
MPEYVLGTDEAELARLTLQQEVWGPTTEAFLDRVGVPAGARCLDVGCGPGLLVESLRRRVGPRGRVDALDESPAWHAHLERLSRERRWENVSLLRARVEDAALEDGAYDVVLARWVLSFLPHVERVVARLARALAPGGVLVVQDYNHEGVSLFPESEGFRAIVQATRRLYAQGGGNAWVAGRLPRDLRAGGLRLERYDPTVLCGGPTSPAFRWADAFFPLHAERMVARGVLSPEDRDRFLRDWDARRRDPDAVFFSPILVSVSARRREGPGD